MLDSNVQNPTAFPRVGGVMTVLLSLLLGA